MYTPHKTWACVARHKYSRVTHTHTLRIDDTRSGSEGGKKNKKPLCPPDAASPPRKEIDKKRLTADWEGLLKQLIKLWELLKVHITGDMAQPPQLVYTFHNVWIKQSFVPRVMRLWIEHNRVLPDLLST